MLKSGLFLALFAWAAASLGLEDPSSSTPLKEERLSIEYTLTAGEAALVMSAESEVPLGRVELFDPEGRSALRLQAGNGRDLSLSGFNVESRESSLEDLLAAYPAGLYTFGGSTSAGHLVTGSAVLAHELPRPARITWPVNGSAGVPTSGLTVNWQAEAATTGFHVILEQNENDGLSVFLPADARSLQIPDGVLAKGTRTLLEIATLAENGNRTVVEVRFETR